MQNSTLRNRPEIERANDYLSKEQRTLLETQKKRIEYYENKKKKEIDALVGIKYFENIQRSLDLCWEKCLNKTKEMSSSISPMNKLYPNKTSSVLNTSERKCAKNCLLKKEESFQMLLHYFAAKMKKEESKKEDFQQLYDVPDKFKSGTI